MALRITANVINSKQVEGKTVPGLRRYNLFDILQPASSVHETLQTCAAFP